MPFTLRAGAVSLTALALAATTLTAAPATGTTTYLEPTVTVAEGRAALPEPFSVIAATETQVAVALERSGVRLLSGPDLSVSVDIPDVAWTPWGGFVGDRYVWFEGAEAVVADVATGSTVRVPTEGEPVGDVTAAGWLEHGTSGDSRALVLATPTGGGVTRTTLGRLPEGTIGATSTLSPTGRRALVDANRGGPRTLVDVDLVGRTVTTLSETYESVDAVSDDAYVLTRSDGTRVRRGADAASWTPKAEYTDVFLWDGRTYEHQPTETDPVFWEVKANGTHAQVATTPALLAAIPYLNVRTGDASGWVRESPEGVLQRVAGSTVTDVLAMPVAPLSVRAADVTDGVVRWIDDARSTVRHAGNLWARGLEGPGARSLVVPRATGRTLAVESGTVYAARLANPATWGFDLVRSVGGGAPTSVVALDAPGDVSVGEGRVGVTGYPRGVVVTLATGTRSLVPSLKLVAGRWAVQQTQVGPLSGTVRLTATAGGDQRVVEVPGYFSTMHAVGTRVVVQAALSSGGYGTYVVELSDGRVTTLPVAGDDRLVGAGPGRVVVQDDASGDLVVHSLYDGSVLTRLRTDGAEQPVVALDRQWVTWTTAGPDGDRLVAAPLAGTPSPTFTDVADGHPFRTEIGWLVDRGIADGYSDGSFRDSAAVSRQAMAAFLYRAAGSPSFTAPNRASFTDVPTSHPFFREVEWLAGSGVAGGYADGTFRPTAPVSRQAMAAFLHRYAGEPAPAAGAPTFPDVPASNQFRTAISWLAGTGVTTGYADGTFKPAAAVSRQAMAAFLYRYDRLED